VAGRATTASGATWKLVLACMFGTSSNATISSFAEPPGRSSSVDCSSRHPMPGSAGLPRLSVYAAGYLARPLGSIVFGHFGDRVGRRSMLALSMLLMGIGTFCAFAPSDL
jgi:MFS family permease